MSVFLIGINMEIVEKPCPCYLRPFALGVAGARRSGALLPQGTLPVLRSLIMKLVIKAAINYCREKGCPACLSLSLSGDREKRQTHIHIAYRGAGGGMPCIVTLGRVKKGEG